ncbi:MAG TPA: homoserine O-succinyltransferase [Candidatus Dormibacteraeota bacterium]|nr:homoserine O-succinyltransferase [Candidatus Dormibacteraeota bacterium]
MPLVINGGHAPEHWLELQRHTHAPSTALASAASLQPLKIALVNNMPDAALEDTEAQFFSLIESAAGGLPVDIRLVQIAEVPRGDRVQVHLSRFYILAEELWNHSFDGAIITGTEPRQRNLRDEPYWKSLTDVFDWAEAHTASTVLSCLAAHASVLHSDNIDRHPLPDKQFGVFDYRRIAEHDLTDGLPSVVHFPHSRWNEVKSADLRRHGYQVLDESPDAGVNLFVKKKGRSLFVHFQGHPEYGTRTLLKEYRRDIRRFLKHERTTYPFMPHGYFDGVAARFLSDFQQGAEAERTEETLEAFPEARLTETLKSTWHASASQTYRNWLNYLLANRPAEVSQSALSPAILG